MGGLTIRADWADIVQFQATSYSGTMENSVATIMNGKEHKATLVGIKADWENVVAYAEWAKVKMDVTAMGNPNIMNSDAWYTTLGYRFGSVLPYVSYENLEQGDGDKQHITTLGARWDFMKNVAFKAAVSKIESDSDLSVAAMNRGGLFESLPSQTDTMYIGIGVDLVF